MKTQELHISSEICALTLLRHACYACGWFIESLYDHRENPLTYVILLQPVQKPFYYPDFTMGLSNFLISDSRVSINQSILHSSTGSFYFLCAYIQHFWSKSAFCQFFAMFLPMSAKKIWIWYLRWHHNVLEFWNVSS